ncbi:MAG: Gfo/Idh/MocA family protein [Christensenellaceae bacterium]|jgi:predicted dehydrogenase
MKKVNVGLIGAGWMGTFYSQGFLNVQRAYGTEVVPVFKAVADPVEAAGKKVQEQFGYQDYYADWKDLLKDPEIDLVVITTPNYTHRDIVVAAAEAGKHIVCEKPMAMNVQQAKEMADAVKKAGVLSLVDFIYRRLPISAKAKKMVDNGELGEIFTFRGEFDCSYCADPNTPMTWRQYKDLAGTGALGDLTTHIISLSDMIVGSKLGKIVEVNAVWDTVYKKRPKSASDSTMVDVENEDEIYIMVKYENGRIGQMSSGRISVGKPCEMSYEIQGSKGTIRFNLMRLNELEVALSSDVPDDIGYKSLVGNVGHGDYFNFSQLNGLGVSYGDTMGIQAHSILKAIADNKPVEIDIQYGYEVERICAAIEKSAKEERWVKVSEV